MGEGEDDLRGILSNSFSALAVSRSGDSSDNILQQIYEHEQEIIQLRKHLAEVSVRESQIQNEKQILEKRISSMRNAFDKQQEDLIEATSKAISYRQDVIEENIRLGYTLQATQEENSIYVSSLVPLLADYPRHPSALDAQSIVSNLRILFKHYKERLAIAKEKLRDSQYQPLLLHSNGKEPPVDDSSHSDWTHSSFAPSPETVDVRVERQHEQEEQEQEAVNPHYLPSILEEEPSSSSHPEADDSLDDNGSEDYDDDDTNKPLPTIEGLQILGEPFPGQEIQASGYSRNGTTHCGFEWVRHLQDGSVNYIEGAKQPTYTITADDVDTYLAVEVQPLDDRQRKGELVKCFANNHKKITCHPDMLREIETTLNIGHTTFKLSVWKGSVDIWEHAILEIKRSSYVIKTNPPNGGVLVDEKYTPTTAISLPAEVPLEFSISSPGGEQYLRADYGSNDISCSRDTIVLTMRLFIKRAVDRKLGKKKRRVLFFK